MKGVIVHLAHSATRPAPVPALVLAAAAIGWGCGEKAGHRRGASATGPSPALHTVRSAAKATLAAAAGVRFTLLGAHAFGSSSAPVLGEGEFDFRSGSGTESIDLGETGKQEPGNERIVFLPAEVYLQPKSQTAGVLPKGKEWVSATLAGAESVATNFPGFALQAEGVNPQLLLTEIALGAVSATPAGGQAAAGGHAAAGGQAAGGGQAAAGARLGQMYDVTVDLPRALARLTGSSAAVFGEAIRSELAFGESASIEASLAGGRVVEMQAVTPGAGSGMATMKLCCFGQPVAVAAPARARTVDIASLTPSGERENNGGGDSDGG